MYSSQRHRGAHLLEVLIALAVMAIGCISGVSLFTAAVERSAKAAKETRATDLRNNAEAAIDIHPEIVRNPDRSTAQHAHRGEKFVFDPLGVAILGSAKFGNLNRYAGDWGATVQAADSICTEQDTWITKWESLRPVEIFATSTPVASGTPFVRITLPTVATIPTDAAGKPSGRLRITMISTGWDHAESRIPVSATVGTDGKSTEFNWWRDSQNPGVIDAGEGSLPEGLVTTTRPTGAPVHTLGKVKVELSERRYSWLATVKQNDAGDCSVDVVVYFSRAFDTEDETVFSATGKQGDSSIVTTAPRERLKAGAFIFDADNCWWYRITSVSGSAVVIETPAVAECRNVLLPRGIVDVWPLRQK